ncbi:biotin synthase BioB [Olivibacter sp. XZL3]|uniref:biotin synthase BioB n=1 Tax=Olivibacter sp. XZL3 TaxID=1735116 RepID=UPI001065638C|nr:biotin synthase BioB [Olivibacter sp. XZL3]
MSQKHTIRNDWSIDEVRKIYNMGLLALTHEAADVHRTWHDPAAVQLCTLLSIKTGGCPEDCAYCGQAARYHTDIEVKSLMPVEEVLACAKRAREAGSTRFCMAAAWREVRDNRDFERVLEMVKGVNDLGMEVCCTLGMLSAEQAKRLREAGLSAYNHNLDSSKDYYQNVISTRTFDDRLLTLQHVRQAGISVCCGGIIGLGESEDDRIAMLHKLATLPSHPESVPINALARVNGTPLANLPKVQVWEMIRMIATARILMPTTMIRLSAGRSEMSTIEQAWCFMAGANSIFTSEQRELLVTPNPDLVEDKAMFRLLGLRPLTAYCIKDEDID